MDWLDLPPMNALRAFTALAEGGGFAAAGRRLNVTHAAISQQVRGLEARLGVALVERDGRNIRLTPAGRLLARDLETAFDYMRRGLERVAETRHPAKVEVTCSPAFAACWLMPRLSRFQTDHPEIALTLNPSAALAVLEPGGIDVAIRYSDARRVHSGFDPLLVCDMSVVAAPDLVAGRDPADLATMAALPWLQELGTAEVADIAAHLGLPAMPPISAQMPGYLIHEALRRGDGATYTPRPFVAGDIVAGRLVELARLRDFGMFHILLAHGAPRPAVRIFLRWLRREAAAS